MKDKQHIPSSNKLNEENTMNKRTETATYKQARGLVESTISDLLPIVQNAELAIEHYYANPSIRNGSYMADMRKLA